MNELRKKLDTAIMLITHDLGVVAQVCDRVDRDVRRARDRAGPEVRELFKRPKHPYTKALLESIPKAGNKRAGQAAAHDQGHCS
jgi:peptide/nickel transport system ATP-binding protein